MSEGYIKVMKKRCCMIMAGLMVGILLAGCQKSTSDDLADKLKEIAQASEVQSEVQSEAQPEEKQEEKQEETDGGNEPAATKEKVDLKESLIKETGAADDEIAVFAPDDFDGDGKEEAFALVGRVIDEFDSKNTIDGTVWFVSEDGCSKLTDSAGMGMYDEPRYMTMGDIKYVMFDEAYATALVTYVWSVSDGVAVEASFSGLGEVHINTADGENRFRIMDSSYDCMYNPESDSWLGHTWKDYYFFYNSEDKEVQEYAGTDITDETVEFLCGKDLIAELVPKTDQISGVFCRGNSLIVINYEHVADGCVMYYHYIYDFGKESLVDDSREECGEEPLDGICKAALCEKIANYPEVPTPGQ